jgi:hypothetical protein
MELQVVVKYKGVILMIGHVASLDHHYVYHVPYGIAPSQIETKVNPAFATDCGDGWYIDPRGRIFHGHEEDIRNIAVLIFGAPSDTNLESSSYKNINVSTGFSQVWDDRICLHCGKEIPPGLKFMSKWESSGSRQ